METKILNALRDLGYTGELLEESKFKEALLHGPKSVEYTQLVNYLTKEIRTISNIDEEVNAISGPEDSAAFIMEISSFLKELNCPYVALTQGHVSDRLQNVADCLLLLDYLCTELMGARILHEKKPEKKIELKLQETSEAADMRKMLVALRFPKPPPNITPTTLFQKLVPSVQNIVKTQAGKNLVGNPFLSSNLLEKQWDSVEKVQEDLHKEYKIRREMLLTRLDVTIQSFQWSDRTKGKDDVFEKIYKEKRKLLKTDPNVNLSDILSARDELAIIEKTSSSTVRKNTKSSIQKVIIGEVPDRGGRTNEQAPPPPEMPSWQQRQPGPAGGRGGGQQRGGYSRGGGQSYGDGGRGQQNYSTGNSSRGNYQTNSAGYGSTKPFDSSGSYASGSRGGKSKFDSTFTSISSFNTSLSGYSSVNNTDSDMSNKTRGRDFGGSAAHKRTSSGSDKHASYQTNPPTSYTNDQNTHFAGNYDSSSGQTSSNFDSAGSYDASKRTKTYDSFQTNRQSYSDQYVQDTAQNQQYHSGGGRGRGRSNYNRGGGRGGGGNYHR